MGFGRADRAVAIRIVTTLAQAFATALAIIVLPLPGGPYSSTPFGGFRS